MTAATFFCPKTGGYVIIGIGSRQGLAGISFNTVPAVPEKTSNQGESAMDIPENIFSTLTEEQKKKAEAARSPEELLAIAEETGYVLSREQLDAVSGGWCPDCGKVCQMECQVL